MKLARLARSSGPRPARSPGDQGSDDRASRASFRRPLYFSIKTRPTRPVIWPLVARRSGRPGARCPGESGEFHKSTVFLDQNSPGRASLGKCRAKIRPVDRASWTGRVLIEKYNGFLKLARLARSSGLWSPGGRGGQLPDDRASRANFRKPLYFSVKNRPYEFRTSCAERKLARSTGRAGPGEF